MSIVVVGGPAKGAGKTALIEGIVAATPEAAWTAIKVSSHAHRGVSVFAESEPEAATDTGRYLRAGARRALLVEAADSAELDLLHEGIDARGNLIIESNRLGFGVDPDLRLAVFAEHALQAKPSFAAFLARADALVVHAHTAVSAHAAPPGIPMFVLEDFRCISPQFAAWMHDRLSLQFRSGTARS
ncbi:MAG TPA: hypothetical protein VGR64_11270 [Terracidiphilus sp.]|nr:hypothetical protein [Terracidiphilus sp.]